MRCEVAIIPDITSPFYTELVVGMEEEASRYDPPLSLRTSGLSAEREHAHPLHALRSEPSAVVLTAAP